MFKYSFQLIKTSEWYALVKNIFFFLLIDIQSIIFMQNT